MIAGIVACQPLSFPEQEGVPEGALVHLDFLNGIFFDGAMADVADVIDHPEWIGAGGLEIRTDNETTAGTGIAHVIGDALAVLLTNNWTVVIEYQEINTFNSDIIQIQDASWEDLFQIRQNADTLTAFENVTGGGGSSRAATPSGAYGLGIHRVAVTATTAKLAISGDGSAVNVDNTARTGTYAPTHATFGGLHGDFIFNEINIRSLTVYAPQSDAALPSLSA